MYLLLSMLPIDTYYLCIRSGIFSIKFSFFFPYNLFYFLVSSVSLFSICFTSLKSTPSLSLALSCNNQCGGGSMSVPDRPESSLIMQLPQPSRLFFPLILIPYRSRRLRMIAGEYDTAFTRLCSCLFLWLVKSSCFLFYRLSFFSFPPLSFSSFSLPITLRAHVLPISFSFSSTDLLSTYLSSFSVSFLHSLTLSSPA